MEVDICFSPALYPAYHRSDAVVVVVDIFRATTTIAVAFENGVRSIRPVASTEEAKTYKNKGWLVGAERNALRCDFADFGNSPFDYTPEKVSGKDIVFTTTNGTKAINCAKNAHCIITGAFVNLHHVADFCLNQQRDVVMLCSGWENKINIEDTLFGGALYEQLQMRGFQSAGDATAVAFSLWNEAKNNLRGYIEQSEHIKRLKENKLDRDISYCLTQNNLPIVPIFDKKENRLIIL